MATTQYVAMLSEHVSVSVVARIRRGKIRLARLFLAVNGGVFVLTKVYRKARFCIHVGDDVYRKGRFGMHVGGRYVSKNLR